MIKVTQTLLFDKWSVTKKWDDTKRRRRLIILLCQRMDLLLEAMHLVLTCPFSLHQRLGAQLFLG